ncbi:DJ-1/PfpI family protein [Brachybacterium saurashtrense]|uniref:DJ-1/PfpI family protein n=1 Tax=Brachybacterium saurashtrense TaxID=556288 RepID=A0A345YLQ4_9MICO|nr:DJ-1/PfpI family protein [Brachybacterium saurashtrense]AXK44856.1 DJ-1/PfpI family protein [Brachybacterium saurashtrense]RRR20735.1 DJ-1/PfpI family protein [Brachybacterium saurashtrense]
MQIALVLYPGFTALDVIGPYEVFNLMPDTEMVFVSNTAGPVVADSGVLSVIATHSFADVPDPDLVLVPGGSTGTGPAMEDPELTGWLRQVNETTSWTTSVCGGAMVLGAAGILDGRPATTHWTAQDMLKNFGAQSRPHDRIVRDGKIATAAGVSSGIDFALWLAGELHGRETAEMIQLAIEYDPQPPFDAGHPSKVSEDLRQRTLTAMVPDSAPRLEGTGTAAG